MRREARERRGARGRARAAGLLLAATLAAGGCRLEDEGRQLGEELRSREQATARGEQPAPPPPVAMDTAADTLLAAVPVDTTPSAAAPAQEVIPWVADSASAPQAPPAAAPGRAWTAAATAQPGSGRPVVLRAVRTARNAGFDRVVFEFAGERLPGYRLEYIDRPVRRCGSGDATEVAGEGWLQLRLEPARAHDDAGRVTVAERERALSLPVLKELELTCDFEAQVEWVLGVASPNRYRVLQLSNPTRLAVDVLH